jgi:glycerol-3-phosphate acyltransferase PlsY
MILPLALSLAVGYVFGLLNTAWLVHRFTSGLDLAAQGSGNLGARNLYDVTGKAWLAVFAGLVDAIKGVVAMLVARSLFPDLYAATVLAGLGAIVGHNYNVLLRGKGGRGLATALGVGLYAFPLLVVTWGLMYLVGFFAIRRDVHVGSMVAVIATFFLVLSFPDTVISVITTLPGGSAIEVKVFASAICVLLFLKHVEPIRALFLAAREESDDDED